MAKRYKILITLLEENGDIRSKKLVSCHETFTDLEEAKKLLRLGSLAMEGKKNGVSIDSLLESLETTLKIQK